MNMFSLKAFHPAAASSNQASCQRHLGFESVTTFLKLTMVVRTANPIIQLFFLNSLLLPKHTKSGEYKVSIM